MLTDPCHLSHHWTFSCQKIIRKSWLMHWTVMKNVWKLMMTLCESVYILP